MDDENEVPTILDDNIEDSQKNDGMKCPKCGEIQEKFYRSGGARFATCDSCKERVGLSSFSPEDYEKYVVEVEPKYPNNNRSKSKKKKSSKHSKSSKNESKKREDDEEEDEEDDEEDERERRRIRPETDGSLFKRPRMPYEILEEVLENYEGVLKDSFIEIIVRHAKLRGGMHPNDLTKRIITMKSGVADDDTAAIISEEYSMALQREKEKAIRNDQELPSSLYDQISPQIFGDKRRRSRDDQIGDSIYQYRRGENHDDRDNRMRDPSMGMSERKSSSSDLVDLARALSIIQSSQSPHQNHDQSGMISEKEHKLQLELQEQRLRMEQMQMEMKQPKNETNPEIELLKQQIQEQKEFTLALMDKLENIGKKDEKSAEEIRAEKYEQKLEEMQREMRDQERKRAEDQMEMLKEQIQKIDDMRKEEKMEYQKQIEKIEENMKNMPKTSDGYNEDTYRVVSEGLNHASRLIEQRKPISEIAQALNTLDEGPARKGRFKSDGEINTTNEISELIDDEYIEDYDENEEE